MLAEDADIVGDTLDIDGVDDIVDDLGRESVQDVVHDMLEQAGEEEAAAARPVRSQDGPSPEERARHNVTHLPYRSWCTTCMRAKCPASAHRAHDETEHTIPTVSMDYCFLGNR